MRFVDRDGFARMLSLRAEQGYELIGPTVRDGAIVLDRIDGVDDLPRGVREMQGPGALPARADRRRPALRVGARPRRRASGSSSRRARRSRPGTRDADGAVTDHPGAAARRALRVRRAARLRPARDRDPGPGVPDRRPRVPRAPRTVVVHRRELRRRRARRASASRWTRARGARAGSTSRSPSSTTGFTAEAGTATPAPSCSTRSRAAKADDAQQAASLARDASAPRTAWAARSRRRTCPGLLYRNREHPRWDEVASRCLTCTNCTMVCPTCFCHDLTDEHLARRRRGDARARVGELLQRGVQRTCRSARCARRPAPGTASG